MIDEPNPFLNNFRTSVTLGLGFSDYTLAEAKVHGKNIAKAILDYIPEEVRKALDIHINVSKGKKRKKVNGLHLHTLASFTPEELKMIFLGTTYNFKIGMRVYRAKTATIRHRILNANPQCVVCGIEGSVWLLQQDGNMTPESAVLNLWGKREDGVLIMLTKDHITPKSLGGSDEISNLQTMCSRCNGVKGNELLTIEQVRDKIGISTGNVSFAIPNLKETIVNTEILPPPKGIPFPLTNVLTTQSNLRDLTQIPPMVEFVKQNGIFTKKVINAWARKNGWRSAPPLIALSRFPNGVVMVHDGHHRVVAIELGGRDYLHPAEYVIKDFTYEEYMEINFDQTYVTPFDPRTHMRIWDFKAFKAHVMELHKSDPDAAIAYINEHPELYRAERDIHTVKDLVKRVQCRLDSEPKPADEEQCLTPKSPSIAIVESSTPTEN